MGNGEMKLNRYPKYKPTGIAWLPELPEGWEVHRVATLLKIKDCPSAPNEELLSVFLDRGVIRFSEGGEKRANATSKDLSKYQLVEVDPESVKVAPTLARWGSHHGLIWSCRPGGDSMRAGFRLPEWIFTAA